MLSRRTRLTRKPRRSGIHQREPVAGSTAPRSISPCSQELLEAAWVALNVARDNKALVVTSRGAIARINQLASQLCGRSLKELLGRNVTAELFENPPAQHVGAAERWVGALKTSSGSLIPVEVTRQPLGIRVPEVEVYAIRDLRERQELARERELQNSELRQRERELKAQNAKFDAALENMLQGLAMFDAEQRLIVCNKRYAEMYGLTPEQVRTGTTVRQILEYRIANGHYHVRDTETFVDSWTSSFGEVSSRIQELADGRIISVTRRRMADGGRLVTHEDITERQKLNARLAQQNQLLEAQEEKLRAQNLQLDAALDNMVQGLAMFDAEQRLVVCNRRYAELYGLTPEQVKPGTTIRQLLEYRNAKGVFGKVEFEKIRARLAGRVQQGLGTHSGACRRAYHIDRTPAHAEWRLGKHDRRHHRTAPLGGQDCPHGAARYADGPAQPRAPQRAAGPCPDPRQDAARWSPPTCSILITSSTSTTRWAIPPVTSCCRSWPIGCAAWCERRTRSHAWAAMSLPLCRLRFRTDRCHRHSPTASSTC